MQGANRSGSPAVLADAKREAALRGSATYLLKDCLTKLNNVV